jgi:hypothetical protein
MFDRRRSQMFGVGFGASKWTVELAGLAGMMELVIERRREAGPEMSSRKPKEPQRFPVMAGSEPAPREKQIAGIVQRVWADSKVYHQDVETLLREWLSVEKCVITDQEFAALLSKARGEFERVATTDGSEARACPAHTLVECVYWDVEELERAS